VFHSLTYLLTYVITHYYCCLHYHCVTDGDEAAWLDEGRALRCAHAVRGPFTLTHSLTHSLTQSLSHTLIFTHTHSQAHSHTQSHTHSLTVHHSTHLLTDQLRHSLTSSLTHFIAHFIAHSLYRSLHRSLTHSLAGPRMQPSGLPLPATALHSQQETHSPTPSLPHSLTRSLLTLCRTLNSLTLPHTCVRVQ
jgi:hypothetical protein